MNRILLVAGAVAAGLALAARADRFQVQGVSPAVHYDADKAIEAGDAAVETAVIHIHGWGGGIKAEGKPLRSSLAGKNVYIVSPLFPRREKIKPGAVEDDGRAMWGRAFDVPDAPDTPNLPQFDWRGGGDALGTRLSSFDVIDTLLSRLCDTRLFPKLRRIVLVGFSAGGQFVGRYVAVGKGAVRAGVTLDYAVIAPSTELLLNDDEPWHYGLRDRARYAAAVPKERIMANLAARRVWRGCGTEDVKPGALDKSPVAVKQGKNRYDRYRNFQRYVGGYPDWNARLSFHDIPGVGHSGKVFEDPALLAYITGERPCAFDRRFLEDLLRIPSQTSDLPANNRCVEFIRDYLSRRGVSCAVLTNERGRKCLYAATTPGKVHDYLFVSHIDVVPAANPGQYEPKAEGDWLYARGACDTKGNVAVIAQVLVNLVGKASVGAFIATDEDGPTPEKGKPTPQLALDEGYVPRRMVLVGDSAGEDPSLLFYAEKGHARIRLVARGKGGHSSEPWTLDNPVPKLVAGYAKAMAAMPQPPTAEDNWRDCLSPTMLKGSDAGNQIPDCAEMTLSLRFVERDGREKWMRFLRETTGLEVETYGTHRLPVVSDPDDANIQRLLAVLKRRNPKMRLGRMSAATDASYYATLNLPTVIFGAWGEGAHSAAERVSLQSLSDYVEALTEFLKP